MEPPGVLRLAAQLPVAAEPQTRELIPQPLPLGDTLYTVASDLDASSISALEFEVAGRAEALTIAWRTAEDREFPRFRRVTVPLQPDGAPHLYTLPLTDQIYWNGRILALRLSVTGGDPSARLMRLTAVAATSVVRRMALDGETLEALPASTRIELPLPAGLPRDGHLRLAVGLLPELDKAGVDAHFRAAIRDARGRETVWLETTLDGARDAGRWHWLTQPVRLPSAGTVVLTAEGRRGGQPLPAASAFWGSPRLTFGGGAAKGSNLLVILVDTVRADALGAWGATTGVTPHLDHLATEATRFAALQAPAPWTLPSVTTLFTGLPPTVHGAGQRREGFAPTGLTPSAQTLAEVLRGQGFLTAGIYNNIFVNPAFGLDQGFDHWHWIEKPDADLADAAIEKLRDVQHERFFLYLHLFDPHNPYAPAAEDCALARRLAPAEPATRVCDIDRRPEVPNPPPADRPWARALYDAELAAADRAVGRVLAELDALDLAESTVVLVLSDHGEDFWAHLPRLEAQGYHPNADHGHQLYQELLHVPALLRVPGRPAAVYEPVATTADLFPTVLGALGAEPPPSLGVDLLAQEAPTRRTFLATHLLHGPERWAIRRGPWKLIVPREAGLAVELYDLAADPSERQDVAAAHPQVVAELRAFGERELETLARQALGQGATNPLLEWNHITKLRALGYLK